LYLDAINDPNSIPNVQTSWETHVQRKCQDAKRKAMLAYDKKIKAALFKLPCDGDKILASHESAIRQSMTIFNEETAGISSDHTKRDYEELMVRKMLFFLHLPSFLHSFLLFCLSSALTRFPISLLPFVLPSIPYVFYPPCLAPFFLH